jgi:hypothetical protein
MLVVFNKPLQGKKTFGRGRTLPADSPLSFQKQSRIDSLKTEGN